MTYRIVAPASPHEGAGGRVVRAVARRLNPRLFWLAGSGAIPIWAVIRHRGRRSGRVYDTPIALRPTADGFVIPLPFTERRDWCRNVLAAGGAVIRWKGVDHEVVAPQVVDAAAASAWFPAPLRLGLRAFDIRRLLLVQRA